MHVKLNQCLLSLESHVLVSVQESAFDRVEMATKRQCGERATISDIACTTPPSVGQMPA